MSEPMPMKCVACGYVTAMGYMHCPHDGNILNTAPELDIPEVQQWEHFLDSAYFDMWCVRKVGETRFGQGFHVPSEAEAVALKDALSQTSGGAA